MVAPSIRSISTTTTFIVLFRGRIPQQPHLRKELTLKDYSALESCIYAIDVFSLFSRLTRWAFGIVLWEICTLGGFPYPTISDRDLLRYLENGKRMDKPTNCTNEIYTIMLDCWSHLPEDRPTFGNLRDLLWKLKNNENPYVNIDPLENFSLPPIDTEGIEDDSYENIPLNIPSPARVTKTESPRKVVSREKNVQQGMSNPTFRPLNHQDSDDSEPKEEKDETLKELEDNLANSSC